MRKRTKQYFDYLVEIDTFSISYMFAHIPSRFKHERRYEEFLHPRLHGKVKYPKSSTMEHAEIILLCNRSLDRCLSDETYSRLKSAMGVGSFRNRKGTLDATLSTPYGIMSCLAPALYAGAIKYLSLHGEKIKRNSFVYSYHFTNQYDEDNYT